MQRSSDPFEDQHDSGLDGREGVGIGALTLRALLAYPVSVAVLTLLGLAGGLLLAATQSNLYVSEAKIQIRLGAREQRTVEGAITDEFQRLGSSIAIGDVVHVFTDPMLHERVAEIVGVEGILQPADPTQQDDESTTLVVRSMHQLQVWWNRRQFAATFDADTVSRFSAEQVAWKILASGVVVSSSPLDSTVGVRFTAQSPERAQEIVQAYLDVFQARHREVFDSASQFAFIDSQLALAVASVEELAERVAAERIEFTVFDIGTQISDLHRSIEGVSALARTEEADLASAVEQLALLNDQYGDVEPTVAREPTRTMVVNTDYSALVDQQRETVQLIDDVGAHFPAGSVGYEAGTAGLKTRLERIREELASCDRFVQLGDDTPVLVDNRLFGDVVTSRLSLEQQVTGLEARIDKRSADVTTQHERLAVLFEIQPKHEALLMDLQRSEARVLALMPTWERGRMLLEVEQDLGLNNIRVVQNPTLDPKKIGPNRKKFILMGLLAGLVLGIGSAIARRLLDSRIYHADELKRLFDISVFGSIPETSKWRRWGRIIRTRS